MSEFHVNFEDSAKAAKELGCVIREPKANELFVDIDNDDDFVVFTNHVNMLSDIVKSVKVTPSKSGGARKHAVVTLNRKVKSLTERVMLQAILGSDRTRELFSFRRIEAGNRRCTLFFEKANG